MYLIFLDTETTGLNPEKHRIIDIAYRIFDSVTGNDLMGYQSLVAQTQEVWAEADPVSVGVNGYTWEETMHGKTEKSVANEITDDLNQIGLAANGGVFICQNPSFDRCFFLQLINADMQTHYGWPYHWLDLASMYWAARTLKKRECLKTFKESHLSKDEIARYYKIAPEQFPHKAMNGVNHLIACYEAIFGPFKT